MNKRSPKMIKRNKPVASVAPANVVALKVVATKVNASAKAQTIGVLNDGYNALATADAAVNNAAARFAVAMVHAVAASIDGFTVKAFDIFRSRNTSTEKRTEVINALLAAIPAAVADADAAKAVKDDARSEGERDDARRKKNALRKHSVYAVTIASGILAKHAVTPLVLADTAFDGKVITRTIAGEQEQFRAAALMVIGREKATKTPNAKTKASAKATAEAHAATVVAEVRKLARNDTTIAASLVKLAPLQAIADRISAIKHKDLTDEHRVILRGVVASIIGLLHLAREGHFTVDEFLAPKQAKAAK